MSVFKTTQSDLIQYNGKKIVGIKPSDEKKYDKEDVGLMFDIVLEGGIELQAFADEIIN